MRAVIIIILGIILLAYPWNMKSDGLEHISGERGGQMKESDAGTMGEKMSGYDFDSFPNVTISGIDISSLSEDELSVLHAQAGYCQAMTDADTDAMCNLVSEDMVYTVSADERYRKQEFGGKCGDEKMQEDTYRFCSYDRRTFQHDCLWKYRK